MAEKKKVESPKSISVEEIQETASLESVPVVGIQETNPIRLNLGCGFRKIDGYTNVDCRELCKPDQLWDIIDGIPYDSSSVDEIIANDFMEHIPTDKVPFVMKEIHRVLKPTGFFIFSIPSTDGRGAFQDPTHVSFWNINSWLYYCEDIWHDLYPDLPKFGGLETIHDVVTSQQRRIVHTRGKVWPIK